MNRETVILADRWIRLAAAILDSLIVVAAMIPVLFMLSFCGCDRRRFPSSTVYHIILSVVGGAVFLCVNGYLLRKNGQTVGKKVLGIRIVSTTEEELTPWRLFFLRYVTIYVVSGMGSYGWVMALLDPIMIFKEDKKCLHDHLAGTMVVKCRTEEQPSPDAKPDTATRTTWRSSTTTEDSP